MSLLRSSTCRRKDWWTS